MAKATSYRDLIKANDLITKNFLNNNSFAVITETKAGDVSFKSTVSGDKTKGLSAVVEPKYELREHNLAFEGKASTANAFTVKGTYKNLVPDLNLSLTGERSLVQEKTKEGTHLKELNSITGGAVFNNNAVNFSADVKYPLGGKLNVNTAVHAKLHDNVDVGVKVDYELNGKLGAEAKVVGGNPNVEGAFTLLYPSFIWGLSVWHSPNSNLQWAAQLSVPPGEDKKNHPTVVVAKSYRFDDSTTIKTKLNTTVDRGDAGDHAFRAGLSLQQKVNTSTTVTIGADVNLNQALGLGKKSVGSDSTAGFQVNFKA